MASRKFELELISIRDTLYNFAYSLTANHEDAEDLLQDTILKALKYESKFIDNVNFRGWVFTIMRNTFINYYRKNILNKPVLDSEENQFQLDLPQESGINSPEESIAVDEINRAISAFSDDQRIPFEMHIEGYKYHEIAETMNMPIGTIKSRIFFTRKKLIEILNLNKTRQKK